MKAQLYYRDVVLPHQGDECLIWPHGRNDKGWAVVRHEGRTRSVHRIACIAVHGEPPTPKHEAAHSCGKAHLGCVNPRHLSWKTRKENEDDKIIHGTYFAGRLGNRGGGKLSKEDVRLIRDLRGKRKQVEIAAMLSVTERTIRRIQRREDWGWFE